MAGAFSQYLQQSLLNHAFKTASFTQPTTIYIGLCTATPSDTTVGTECTGTNYARIPCNTWVTASAASPSVISNTATISFATPGSGGWGTASYFVIMDTLAATTNILAWGTLSTPKTINSGDTVSFAANQLTISLD